MIFGHSASFRALPLALALAVGSFAALSADRAAAQSMLLIEADSGRVLHAENATHPWYPASVTKVMTAYVTLKAVKAGRISLDTLITVSPNAAAQAPTKMGFKIGSQITVDNALKTIMVKSANDMSVALAEGVSGSIAAFAEEMNAAAKRLGMTQTTYVNPNGLPADEQITSARDQAILARAIYNELPEYDRYWNISAIKYGKRIMRNYNTLLGRYPGTDGLKTGFICASGFNIVVSAKRNGRRLIAVMLGAPSGGARAVKVAQMLERGFASGGFSWLTPSAGTVESLKAIDAQPPNLREEICGKKRKRPARESEDVEDEVEASLPPGIDPNSPQAVMLSSLRVANNKPSALLGEYTPTSPTVEIFLGASKGSVPVEEPAVAAKKSRKKKDVAAAPAPAAAPAAASSTAPQRAPAPASAAPAIRGTQPTGPAQGAAAARSGTATATPAPVAKPAQRAATNSKAFPTPVGTAPASQQAPAKKKPAAKKPDPTAEATAKPAAQKPAASAR
ncbi:D-alanyl-D-alanine carboxypeptidase family protein [Pseudorhodoplanes sp.]|uniref:D-alanyl-D-alanine carboxypeptidase family protein n=1 Tax=Pseudorhodoplanes sp. TaxID=1934341 RepID=UPI002B56AC89|nr:D-alanyl-D-alanine carboxypeptidase family protein [Pseudorhodoplanes sp.]HWV52301.1 D-alanyl-D-alanine carboxypeptidase family protein [Pseudorhodoplanes sp.]